MNGLTMVKLSVQQYANEYKTNVQQVYRQIKKGSLTTVKENGKILVLVEDIPVKQTLNNDKQTLETYLTKENKRLNKELKLLNKINQDLYKKIEKLNKKIEGKNTKVEETLLTYITELKQFQLEHKPKYEDAEVVPKKKKNKPKK